jgi:hypothetical protein
MTAKHSSGRVSQRAIYAPLCKLANGLREDFAEGFNEPSSRFKSGAGAFGRQYESGLVS